MIEEDYIKLIFGLKLKQIRHEKDLSLFGLSKKTGLSKSYLNEIEKGKKYPKRDKIILLCQALETNYDQMVSLKLDKNLAPIGEILQSKILKEIPLELFGIKESDLVDIISEAPMKVNIFITTLFEISKRYNVSKESFYLAALRSYQESNDNYFDDIEKKALEFSKSYSVDLNKRLQPIELEEILIEEFGYKIITDELDKYEETNNLRSIFVPSTRTLLISNSTDDSQKLFIYAKEIAYNYLKLENRLYTFSWIKFENFEEVLNNFMASYFAGAILIPRERLKNELKELFNKNDFNNDSFLEMMTRFTDSPETFYQRLTNILPKDFNLKNIFFLRFSSNPNHNYIRLAKELHISNILDPQATQKLVHYCRRWVSIRTLEELKKQNSNHVFMSQTSHYTNTNNNYFVISSATKDPFKKGYFRSIGLGIMMTPQAKQKIKFLENSTIPHFEVGVTCETCTIENCSERLAPANELLRKQGNKKTEDIVNYLTEKYSK